MALQQDTKKKTAVLAFGRMNPPTTGHEAMIKQTHAVAKQHGGTAHVVASHKQHKDTDPLPHHAYYKTKLLTENPYTRNNHITNY